MQKIIYQNKLAGQSILFIALFAMMSCRNGEQTSDKDSISKVPSDSFTTANSDSIDTNASTSSQSLANESADWLLIPGMSAGQTKIGGNADSVYKRLGKPDGGDAAMQKAVAIWYSNHDMASHSVAIYTARNTDSAAIARILQIRITSPSFITNDSIHTGSSLSDIQSKFAIKQTETYKDAGVAYKVYDSKQGIAFEVNDNDKCVAIIIHRAGVTDENSYLKFRTTNKFIDQNR